MKILAMLGGIIGIIESIAGFFGWGFWGWGYPIVWPIIGIILSILVLLSVYRPGNPIPYNGIVLLIFGILMIVLSTANIGGILTLVAGILGIIAKS